MGVNLNQGSGRGGRHRPMAEINVTPFVDVMLVLLIIFMVTAPLLTAGVKIDLPDSEAQALSEADDKTYEVSLEKDGTLYVGETKVKEARLVALLSAATNSNPDARIYIRADKAMDYGQVMKVLGTINAAGFRKVALITENNG